VNANPWRRLILVAGALLVAGIVWSLSRPLPGLYPEGSVPVREGELWEITTP